MALMVGGTLGKSVVLLSLFFRCQLWNRLAICHPRGVGFRLSLLPLGVFILEIGIYPRARASC